jgi:hypothetical protein
VFFSEATEAVGSRSVLKRLRTAVRLEMHGLWRDARELLKVCV